VSLSVTLAISNFKKNTMNSQISTLRQLLYAVGFLAMSVPALDAFGAVTVPGAPTIVNAAAGDVSTTITFTQNANGGTATSFTVACVAGSSSKTGKGSTSPITVLGMTNGSAYSCTITATNSKGASVASSAVSVTPATVPGAPTIGAATAGNASASIAFTAPSSNGGATITGYTAACVSGSTTKTGTGTSGPITVASLTNGSAYSCTVTATNSKGAGVASSAVSVTPATVPGVPTIGAATARNASASIAFTAPSSNGGATITGYTAACVSGSKTKTGAGAGSPITVSSLTNGTAYSCTVKATNSAGTGSASSAVSVTPKASTTSTVTYSTPANFEAVVAKSYTPTTTLSASSAVSNRGYYMISDASTASTASNYAAIGSTYSATAGYAVTSGTLASTSTYNDYLAKTMQLVTATDTYYRIDSYLHPNNSIDVDSATSTTLKFKNNFGKTSATGNGFVTFDVTVNATTKVVTLKAKNRYKYSTTTSTSNGSTVYTGGYTLDSTFTGGGKYLAYTSGAYSLNSTATNLYLYVTPLSLGVPSFMNPNSVSFVTNGAAPFLTKVTTTDIEGTSGSIYKQVNSTYQSQVTAVGTNTATKTAATTMLATIKTAVEASGEKLRYSTDVYAAYRDAALATKLVSDSIADGTPGQNLVPYVYFTNEKDTSGKYHPMMVVVSYGNQASPNGLKDVPHPPGSSGSDYKDATVTRYSNLENYTFTIPMKDYGLVTDVTKNVYPSSGTKNLWYDTTSPWVAANVYTWADSADNGILVDGSVMFPAFNNGLVPSHLSGELSASGCHVGQGGGGPHCHADGYQSGQGLGLYNDADYVGKTHPPLLGFGYDGIALFARYRSADTAMLGYGTLDDFGAHNHDSIGYHYHAHTVSSYTSVDQKGASTTKDMYPLMKGAYIGVTSSIPYFRTSSSFATNKYLGGTVK